MTEQEERAERIAKAFHAAYEELAPEHGYTTREASRKLWAEVPERNRALMIGTVKRLMHTGVIADPARVQELEGERDRAERLEALYDRSVLRERELKSHLARLEEALETAADDLGKAANQFASMRESQKAGHSPRVEIDPEIFEEKERRARSALTHSTPPSDDA